MARDGLVSEVDGPEGQADALYSISGSGVASLQAWVRQSWSAPGSLDPIHDLAVLLLDALPPVELTSLLRQRAMRLRERLHGDMTSSASEDESSAMRPGCRALLERTRMQCQSELEWTEDLARGLAAGRFLTTEAAHPSPAAAATRAPGSEKGVGAFTFVLHSHLPYCRMAGRWPHGEEWIHEAASETYVPLLNALYDLREEGKGYGLTLGITPVLAEQLADHDIREHFVLFLDDRSKAAAADISRFAASGESHLESLAGYYRDYYERVRDTFVERFGTDIIGAFRRLQDEGYIEIITSAATHGYLPLLSRDSSIYGQLRTAVTSYERHFGRAPRAIWLPECAYRPAYTDSEGVVRPALEEFLAAQNLTCFFTETHAIEGGRPVGKAAGDVSIGPYGVISRQYVLPVAEAAASGGTTYTAYYVIGSAGGTTSPPVAAVGRDNRTGQQVWSAEWGYPGDPDYREFHRKDHQTGLQYWRVTGPRVDLGDKDEYHPDWAAGKVAAHAQHFVDLLERLSRSYHDDSGTYSIIASNYDTELFGHWWFEGIDWIKGVLTGLADSETLDLTTASEYLQAHPPSEAITLPESSWGSGGNHWTWDNPETHWMWAPIDRAQLCMETLVERHPRATDDALATLNQAARELLLLQSSDWPFLVTTGQARQYAIERYYGHLERFDRLAALVDQGALAEARALANEYWERDKVFPDIDYRWFAARQGRAC